MRRPLMLALLALMSAACGDSQEQAPKPETDGFEPGDRTGLAECDAVIEAHAACIDAKAPKLVQEELRANLEASFAYWLKMARQQPPDERRTELFRHHCVRALDYWTRTAATLGCDPPRAR